SASTQSASTQPASTRPAATQPPSTQAASAEPASTQPAMDTVVVKPIKPRDALERWALNRGPDLRLVDRVMDPRTPVPKFDRKPLGQPPADAKIAENVPSLPDSNPFPGPELIPKVPNTVQAGVGRSTFRTREPEEVLSVVQPFLDLTQKEVAVRATVVLHQTPDEAYHALLDGDDQLEICHVFDYLLLRSWFQS